VELSLQVRHRIVRLVWLPAYLVAYSHAKIQVGSIDILQQKHRALVPAAGARGRIVSERHVSGPKSQALAAAAVLAGSAAWQAAAGEWSLRAVLSVDALFWTFMAASAAGLLARAASGLLRDRHASRVDGKISANHGR